MLATLPDDLSGTNSQTLPDGGSGALPQETHHYDVCFFLNRRRALHWLDRGIALNPDGLSCTAKGLPGAEPLGNIAAVHMKTSAGKSNIESCAITFADGNVVTVLNCNPGGYADAALAAHYRAFVHDLHARLAVGAPGTIRFTEGWPLWRCQAMLLIAAGMALVSAALGLWSLFCLHSLQGPVLLALGGYASWRFYRVALNNLPRDYTPDRLPEFLLSDCCHPAIAVARTVGPRRATIRSVTCRASAAVIRSACPSCRSRL